MGTGSHSLTHQFRQPQNSCPSPRLGRVRALVSRKPFSPSFTSHILCSNVGTAADKLPKSILSKGGAFIVRVLVAFKSPDLHLSPAEHVPVWMSFSPMSLRSSAVKISVGGVNALTGLPQNESVRGKQDYLAIADKNGQL